MKNLIVHFEPATAIIASAAIGATSSAIQANQSRVQSGRAADLAARRDKQQKTAMRRAELEKRSQQRVQNRVAEGKAREAKDVSLQQKGIAPIGAQLSKAILNEGSNG